MLTDDFTNAYECAWQNHYPTDHVNIFCSLGSWASNLTDQLLDDRFDSMDLDDDKMSEIMFRHYTRIFLVLSEILTDFQDMYSKANGIHIRNKGPARLFYFRSPQRFDDIMNFINRVCKHKVENLHICNNHNPIIFSDSRLRPP